jgi:hypothetical protein
VIAMSEEIVIRHARASENDSIHTLVQAIADETFAYLFAPSQVPIGPANWFSAWLAISGEEVVGPRTIILRRVSTMQIELDHLFACTSRGDAVVGLKRISS